MILSKRQLSLFRGNGGGLSPLQAALAQFGFWAPLETSVALYRGYGAASFTRATTATVKDWEGAVRNCVSGEVRFAGQRRVANGITGSIANSSTTNTATGQTGYQGEATATRVRIDVAASYGAYMQIAGSPRFGTVPAGGSVVGSMAVKGYGSSIGKVVGVGFYENGAKPLADITLTAEWQRVSVAVAVATGGADCRFGLLHGGGFGASGSTLALNDEVLVDAFQIELTTGQSNQNPSEYVSVGAAKLNELTYTEEISNAAWTKTAVTYSGTTLTTTATSNGHYTLRAMTFVSGVTYTGQFRLTYINNQFASLRIYDSATAKSVVFDLLNVVIVEEEAGVTGTITALGGGEYLCTITRTVGASGSGYLGVFMEPSTYAAPGIPGNAWLGAGTEQLGANKAQVEIGTTASTYFPVGSVYPYHGACVDGVKYFDTLNGNTVASNVVTEATGAAIDQTNVGYLAESARTNLVLQSSNFGTTWTAGGTPTRSAAAAYCGEIALDLIGDDTAAAAEYYAQTITFTGDATKSISFLVEQGTSTSTAVRLYDSTAAAERLIAVITWSGGAPVVTYTTGSAERASEYMGGGAWRIFCLTASVTAANTNGLRFYPASDSAFGNSGTGDIYIGGVQAENATTASVSHIPTTTATVTRNADVLSYPAAGNAVSPAASLYGESYVTFATSGGRIASLQGSSDRYADLYWTTNPTIAGYAFAGGYSDPSVVGSVQIGVWQKAAMAVAANDANKYINGVSGTPDATVTVSGDPTVIWVGCYASGSLNEGLERNIRVSSTRVSNADLQLITQ